MSLGVPLLSLHGPGWQQTVTAVATGVTALGLLAAVGGALWARSQVREVIKSRLATIAIDVSRRWDENAMLKARQVFTDLTPEQVRDLLVSLENSHKKSELRQYYKLQRVGNYFEDLAVLWKHECLSIEWIHDTVGGAVLTYWEKWSLYVTDGKTKQPTLYLNWANLADKLRGYRLAEDLRAYEAEHAS